MKKFMKMMLSVMLMVSLFVTGTVFADEEGNNNSLGGITIVNPDIDDKAQTFVGKVLGTMQWVGYAIAIGMLIYIGIKYIMASANEKADLKNSLIKYVIGAVLIIGAVTIANWIFTLKL